MADLPVTELEDARTVLVAAPGMGGGHEACSSLLRAGQSNGGVVFVTYTRTPAECIDQWASTGEEADRIGIISVGDSGHSVTDTDAELWTMSSPTDLTGIGIQLGEILSEWEGPVRICFDSVTSLLQYVEFETAYEFLHTVTGQTHAADGYAHFHVDPEAHDEQTLAALTSLMDARLTRQEDHWSVRSRELQIEMEG